MLNETTFKNNIVTWFEKNQREMPWRKQLIHIIYG